MQIPRTFWLVIVPIGLSLGSGSVARSESPLSVEQVVQMAFEANPQVRSARARWSSAVHSINPNYVPADPLFSFSNLDSPTNGFGKAASRSFQVSQPLQFPGKGYLQGKTAERAAEIARLEYEATLRDTRAQAEIAYYQILLDRALVDVAAENVGNLRKVRQVAQVAYAANQVTQADFISAEFDLAAAEQQQHQLEVSEANDRTALNQILARPPAERLDLRNEIELPALPAALEALVARAGQVRQEILQAALTEENAETARTLAQLEYAPDFTIGYTFNDYLTATAPPNPGQTQTHGISIGFNVPLFFWARQREDVTRAGFDLQAARADFDAVKTQTAALVTTLYRQAQLAEQTARLYRDSLTPLARQGFEVALVAYQSGKVDFVTLLTTLRQRNDARVAYLQASNQFLAQRIALEQAIGERLPD